MRRGATAAGAPPLVVPHAELLVVRGPLPTVVSSVPSVGATLSDANATVTFAGATTRATAPLAASVAAKVSVGTVGYLEDAAGTRVEVTVTGVDDGDATASLDPTATLAPSAPTALPAEWTGTEVLAVLTLSTVGKESLIVPSRAVAIAGTGAASVVRYAPDGTSTMVTVEELGTLNGQSAILPVEQGALQVGDLVRVD